ncbi:hypothetical protein GQ457_01G029780 [Hibiscus cannabinus]
MPVTGSYSSESSVASDSLSTVSKAFTNKKVSIVLDETNFLLWKQQILLVVRSHRLKKLLTGDLKAPSATVLNSDGHSIENENDKIYVAQDIVLASWLLSTASPHLLPQFVSVKTAATIWSTVLKLFSS